MSAWSWLKTLGRIVGVVAPEVADAIEGKPPTLDAPLGESQTERARREADAVAPKPKPPT